MKKEKNEIEEKEQPKLCCPFDKSLACDDCRLYQTYSAGQRACVFIRMP